MDKYYTKFASIILLLAAFSMTACGGGGSDDDDDNDDGGSGSSVSFNGNTDPAAITADNAQAIGTASGEAVQQAASTTSAPTAFPTLLSATNNVKEISNIVASTIEAMTLAGAPEIPGICSTGSVFISDFPENPSGRVEIEIDYNNCVISDSSGSFTFDGSVLYVYLDFNNINAGFIVTYNNFTTTGTIGTSTLNATYDCTDTSACVYRSDYVSSDGAIHRVSFINVTGSGSLSDPYGGSFTFTHSVHGTLFISLSGIFYNGTCDPFPSDGTINFSSDTSSGSITFNPNCTVFGSYNDGTTTGSF